MNKLFLILVSIFLIGCSSASKLREYKYINSVEELIKEAIDQVEESTLKPKEGKRSLFVLFEAYNGATSMLFNYIENMPPDIQKHILKSRRYLLINGNKIPILFNSDNESPFVRKGELNYGIIKGCVLQFDNQGEKILLGMAN